MKKYRIEVLCEDIKGKLDLLIKGNDTFLHEIRERMQVLGEKIDMNTFLLRKASKKTDAIAPDLAVQQVGTEVNCGYKVCESK